MSPVLAVLVVIGFLLFSVGLAALVGSMIWSQSWETTDETVQRFEGEGVVDHVELPKGWVPADGRLVRVQRGVYVPYLSPKPTDWLQADPDSLFEWPDYTPPLPDWKRDRLL